MTWKQNKNSQEVHLHTRQIVLFNLGVERKVNQNLLPSEQWYVHAKAYARQHRGMYRRSDGVSWVLTSAWWEYLIWVVHEWEMTLPMLITLHLSYPISKTHMAGTWFSVSDMVSMYRAIVVVWSVFICWSSEWSACVVQRWDNNSRQVFYPRGVLCMCMGRLPVHLHFSCAYGVFEFGSIAHSMEWFFQPAGHMDSSVVLPCASLAH